MTKLIQSMKTLIRETAFFLILSLLATSLVPVAMGRLVLASEAFTVNRMEKLFLIQLSVLMFLLILAVLYVVRLVLTLVHRKLTGSGGGAKP
jgi:hypothetical protein